VSNYKRTDTPVLSKAVEQLTLHISSTFFQHDEYKLNIHCNILN